VGTTTEPRAPGFLAVTEATGSGGTCVGELVSGAGRVSITGGGADPVLGGAGRREGPGGWAGWCWRGPGSGRDTFARPGERGGEFGAAGETRGGIDGQSPGDYRVEVSQIGTSVDQARRRVLARSARLVAGEQMKRGGRKSVLIRANRRRRCR